MSKNFSDIMKHSDMCKLTHKLYDDSGNPIVTGARPTLSVRGKIRCVGADGSIINTHNCTVYGGRRFIIESLFRQIPAADQQLTLNKILNVNDQVTLTDEEKLSRCVCLVGVGTGGAGTTFGSVIDATANDNNLFNIIPMRTISSPLSGDNAEKYFMRKLETINGSNYYNYYLKRVDCNGVFAKHENVDYEPKESDNDAVHDENNPLSLYNIQTFTTIPIEISSDDIKDYFRATDGDINMARFNELALYIGIPKTVHSGETTYTDYVLVEAFSHLTFNNRPMDNEGARYDFTYYVLT